MWQILALFEYLLQIQGLMMASFLLSVRVGQTFYVSGILM